MDLEELNIASLQLSLASQEARAVDVAEAYTRRIDEIDRSGPCLRSVVELSPDLLQDSKRCDEQLANGEDPGPLHGVQLLVKDSIDKDSIDTADGTQTMGGSLALAGNYAERDAFTIERLRNAGAIVMGKTNMSEWG